MLSVVRESCMVVGSYDCKVSLAKGAKPCSLAFYSYAPTLVTAEGGEKVTQILSALHYLRYIQNPA